MTQLTEEKLYSLLADFNDPYLHRNWVSGKIIQGIECSADSINIKLRFGFPIEKQRHALLIKLKNYLAEFLPGLTINLEIEQRIEAHVAQKSLKIHPQIKNIIAIASGKGGVGKSTTAINLALALQQEGGRAGILDADIYGPSQPTMLGVTEKPTPNAEKILYPVMRFGLQSMSIGYLVDSKTAMVWRGPMVSMALQQLLNDTHWDNLDYLIIDLPPGTGDIQLTLAQKIPVSGAVIVTTPQELALLDARRAIDMFDKVNIPVLGVIENMGSYHCTHCGHDEAIFGEGGGKALAEDRSIELLGSMPLDTKIRQQTDMGLPPVVAEPDGYYALLYRQIALRLAAKLSLQEKDYSKHFAAVAVKVE